jgi:hypothetical protein
MVNVPSPGPFTPPRIEVSKRSDFVARSFTPAGADHLIFRSPIKLPPGPGDTPVRAVQLYACAGVSNALNVLIFPERKPANDPCGTAEEVQFTATPVTVIWLILFLTGATYPPGVTMPMGVLKINAPPLRVQDAVAGARFQSTVPFAEAVPALAAMRPRGMASAASIKRILRFMFVVL